MHKLPPAGHKAREMFEVADVVAIGVGERKPVIGRPALRAMGKKFFWRHQIAKRLVVLFMAANGDLQLVSVGRRGGVKVEWNFGQ